MPSHIVESSEVFFSEEFSNDNPIKAPEISQILRRIAKKRRRSSSNVNATSNNVVALRQESQPFLDTLHKFLDCRAKMDAQCHALLLEQEQEQEENNSKSLVDSNLQLEVVEDFELDPKYQQQNTSGQTVQGLLELYQAAKQVRPIYKNKLQTMVQDFLESIDGQEQQQQQVVLEVPNLKDAGRAMEKAKEHNYGDRQRGPSVSWLYDIVRASISFASSHHLLQFVETILLANDCSLNIIQSKNRFQRPAFTGYRDWLIHLQMDTGLGFQHVCELQLHYQPIQQLSQQLGSYTFYKSLRFYFAADDGTNDLEEDRLLVEDLQTIAAQTKGYELQMDSFVSDKADLDRLKRLANNLFHYHLQEYEIAARLECQILLTARVCDVADSYETIGILLLKQDLPQESKLMHEQALQIRMDTNGLKHKSVASSYFHIGLVLEKQEQYYTAITMHNRALTIRMGVLGQKHALVVASYNQIGLVWEQLSQYDDAIYNYEKALQIRLDTLGDKDVLVANSHSNIGCVLEQQGKYQEALESHQQALAIRREIFGGDCQQHRSIPYSLNKIGGVLKELKQYDEAKSMHQQALKIQLEILGEANHPSVAASYNNLGAIYMRQGEYLEAESMHRKALQIRLETLGENHMAVANTYSTLGVILAKQKRNWDEARNMHERALSIRLQALGGEKHISVASSYHCLGVVLEKQGEYKEAESMHKKALEIRSVILGEHHSTVSTSTKRLQLVVEKQQLIAQEEDEHSSSESSSSTSSMIMKIRSKNFVRSVLSKKKKNKNKKNKSSLLSKEETNSIQGIQLQAPTPE